MNIEIVENRSCIVIDTPIHYPQQSHDERSHMQRVRIAQVSHMLFALTADDLTTSGSSIANMTAPSTTTTTTPPTAQRIQQDALLTASNANRILKQKNQQLNDDMAEKTHYIAILERERKMLIRELLQAQRISNQNATVTRTALGPPSPSTTTSSSTTRTKMPIHIGHSNNNNAAVAVATAASTTTTIKSRGRTGNQQVHII